MPAVARNIILAAALIACLAAAARGVAALPGMMRGGGTGQLHTSEEVLFEILKGN